MATLTDFYAFCQDPERRGGEIYDTVICKMERELLQNPINFAMNYNISMNADDIDNIQKLAVDFISKQQNQPTCPSASGNIIFPPPPHNQTSNKRKVSKVVTKSKKAKKRSK